MAIIKLGMGEGLFSDQFSRLLFVLSLVLGYGSAYCDLSGSSQLAMLACNKSLPPTLNTAIPITIGPAAIG